MNTDLLRWRSQGASLRPKGSPGTAGPRPPAATSERPEPGAGAGAARPVSAEA